VTADLTLSALLLLVTLAALVTALARGLVVTLLAFAAYSLGLAMVWIVLRAPDVALTEAAVGAGVTTALFLLLVRRATRAADPSIGPAPAHVPEATPTDSGGPVGGTSMAGTTAAAPRRTRPVALLVAAVVAAGLLATVPALPAVGDPAAPGFGPVTEFYLTDSGERGIDNVVTAVLVVYRGFDTFGEIVVVLAAAVAVLAVFGREVIA
jgi:multicomponent Na+:H+ antiporter subunit B